MSFEEFLKVVEIRPPFRYDPMGQMVFDADNTLVLNVRGWAAEYKRT